MASLLLGELARELGILDDEKEGPYQLIQLVLLLRLLASSWEDDSVRIYEIGLLLERVAHNSQDQVFSLINTVRLHLLEHANLRGLAITDIFDEALTKISAQEEFIGEIERIDTGLSQMQNKLEEKQTRVIEENATAQSKYQKYVDEQRAYFKAVKDFQLECDKNEMLTERLEGKQ